LEEINARLFNEAKSARDSKHLLPQKAVQTEISHFKRKDNGI
jgi:hypothetical protein